MREETIAFFCVTVSIYDMKFGMKITIPSTLDPITMPSTLDPNSISVERIGIG
jgi:hypothetical protein